MRMKKILSVATFLVAMSISFIAFASPQFNRHAIILDSCVQCGVCLGECPNGAISEGDPYVVNAGRCDGCGICMDVCPVGAIWMVQYGG